MRHPKSEETKKKTDMVLTFCSFLRLIQYMSTHSLSTGIPFLFLPPCRSVPRTHARTSIDMFSVCTSVLLDQVVCTYPCSSPLPADIITSSLIPYPGLKYSSGTIRINSSLIVSLDRFDPRSKPRIQKIHAVHDKQHGLEQG
ncbi:hypothetical protein AA313_de0205044 [Arthrobotrys entomopaga]|nr:hypothetical protein AA313_de0205044 [Arthrobotrys entomopaga]